MRYSDPMKLADLPPEHWARISPEAYARLLAEPPIEWLKRGGDGTFNETTATGLDNHSKVLIPWHEFYTKFEWEGQLTTSPRRPSSGSPTTAHAAGTCRTFRTFASASTATAAGNDLAVSR